MSVWSDHVPVADIDPDLIPFFGADPAWTPAKEEKLADAPDKAAGQCINCGGDEGFPFVVDGGRTIVVSAVPPGSNRVCMRCQRTGDDQHSLGARSGRPEVMTVVEPGYVFRDGVSVPEKFAGLLDG